MSQNQAQSYENAGLIFVGDVIQIDTAKGTYKVDVIEVLKGTTKTKTLNGITPTSCSGFPKIGRWILYAVDHGGGQIEFDGCGMSRSFLQPEFVMIKDYAYPRPMGPQESTDITLENMKQILAIKERALSDLMKEISELRKRK